MSGPDEAQLLKRCLQGDEDAWDELFDRHYAPTTRFVFQLAHDLMAEDVEEICQEVFVSVVKNLHTFQGQSQFQTWLFRIAANRARDYRQRQRASKRGGGRAPLSLHAENEKRIRPRIGPVPSAASFSSDQSYETLPPSGQAHVPVASPFFIEEQVDRRVSWSFARMDSALV